MEVRREFESVTMRYPRFAGLEFPKWVILRKTAMDIVSFPLYKRLDSGETMAISLALEIKAAAILIDERVGRNAAEALGLKAFGTVGVLTQAKMKGLLPRLAPVIALLTQKANFYFDADAELVALRLAGDEPCRLLTSLLLQRS